MAKTHVVYGRLVSVGALLGLGLLVGGCEEAGSSVPAGDNQPIMPVASMTTSPVQGGAAPGALPPPAAPPPSPVFAPAPAGPNTTTPPPTMPAPSTGDMLGMAGMGGIMAPPTEPTPVGMGMPSEMGTGMMPSEMGMEVEPPAPVTREDLGEGDGSDVITIGDSWMDTITSGIERALVRVAGQPYRQYGVPGTRLLSEQIPDQYKAAKRADPDIKTVVMTGGGNDIIQVPGLREDCDAGGDLCGQEVGKILDRLTSLWEEMSMDGVQDVVYVQYSDPEGNDVDFALPDGDSVKTRCAAVPAPLRCHTLETNVLVMQDIPDGIHPSAAGFERIAKGVYELMVDQGMRR